VEEVRPSECTASLPRSSACSLLLIVQTAHPRRRTAPPNIRQDKTGQDKTRQDRTGQDETKTRQDKTGKDQDQDQDQDKTADAHKKTFAKAVF